jgi:glyoxylase-like metal-dependent hydrolase (beta-lactamase superfamily II)
MEITSYRFKLGAFDCLAVADGTHDYPLKSFFANTPLAQAEAALRERRQPVDYIRTPYTNLYVDTGAHRVLVDMGAGSLLPSTGRLPGNLRAAGVEPREIDAILITHAHPDHVGGTLDEAGDPIYPNARYYIWKGEWNFWTSDMAFEKVPEMFVSVARIQLQPVLDQLVLLEREGEIMPGISILSAPGHTPGHTVISFESGGERLLYISDTVLHPLHLEHPGWTPIYDIYPDQAEASKRRIFDMAAEEGALVLGQHFAPFPSIGRVSKAGEGWRWVPIVTAN